MRRDAESAVMGDAHASRPNFLGRAAAHFTAVTLGRWFDLPAQKQTLKPAPALSP